VTPRFCPALLVIFLSARLLAQSPGSLPESHSSPGRLSLPSAQPESPQEVPFATPLPAHAAKNSAPTKALGFQVGSGRAASTAQPQEEPTRANYLLPDRTNKPAITPELANLNLPEDLEITTAETDEKIVLPAGTYRQILQLPIDSPLMQATDQIRRDQAPPVAVPKPKSRYAEPEKKPVWVRYESLEKIKIGEAERRGGIDLPSHGPKELGPRLWYAKSETADVASSLFYFVFGGLGYSTANILGWSAGNTREIPRDFEYRLIRR